MRRKQLSGPIRIVALNGSPNKNGNTSTLMQWVVEGAAGVGPVTHTWIDIADRNIEYCRG